MYLVVPLLVYLLQETISPQYQNVGAAASAASVATVLTRLEELSRRVAMLESGLTADVRRILQLLQARDHHAPATAPAHTPSQPLPKASLSVPHTNDVRIPRAPHPAAILVRPAISYVKLYYLSTT